MAADWLSDSHELVSKAQAKGRMCQSLLSPGSSLPVESSAGAWTARAAHLNFNALK